MVRGLRVFFASCAIGCSVAQAAWQAGEPITVNIDYDVPFAPPRAAAAPKLRGFDLKTDVAGRHSKVGFSAAELRGDTMRPDEALVVVHVPSPAGAIAQEVNYVAEAERQLGIMSALAKKQRAFEDEVLQSMGGLPAAVARGASHLQTAEGAAADVSSGRALAELRSEVEAGGMVARGALEQAVSLATDAAARANVAKSGIAHAAAVLMQRPSTDEPTRALAGSLLTLMSGMPVAAEVSDEATGSNGQVEIVLPRPSRVYGPDALSMPLSAGVSPGRVEY